MEHWAGLGIVMRRYAVEQIAERGLDRAWVERVAMHPDRAEPDPNPGISSAFRYRA